MGGVIVDYCLGQTLNAKQAEEQPMGNAEKKRKKRKRIWVQEMLWKSNFFSPIIYKFVND